MFDPEGSAPDVLECGDRAVRALDPIVPIWVDLAALTQQMKYGRGNVAGGVYVGGQVRAILWAQVMTGRGFWLGVVTCELERGGAPIMTVQALVPQWAVRRRRPGEGRKFLGKASIRPTLSQQRGAAEPDRLTHGHG
jgi:hypothetical protein